MSSYAPPNPFFTTTAGYYTGAGQAPSQFAEAYAKNYGTYGQGLASMGNSYANAYGSYMGGLASLANSQANERGARASAASQAEAARQLASGNIGSAALGAYGSAANSAFDAWKGNQQAYNQAASLMHQANQSGLSNYGISRNQALGQLGDAYGNIGKAQVGANALANLNISGMFGGGGGGGGFSASGPDGQIASGSYGGMGGGGGSGFSMTGSRSSSSGGGGGGALDGLAGLRQNLMSRDLPEDMLGEARRGREQLDMQHYSSRGMPSQMLDQTLGGLVGLGNQAYGASGRGMDQFYANQRNEASYNPYKGLAAQMASGYGTVGQQIGGTQRDLTSGFGTANQNIGDLWNNSWGRSGLFGEPRFSMQDAYDQTLADIINERKAGYNPSDHRIRLLRDLESDMRDGGAANVARNPVMEEWNKRVKSQRELDDERLALGYEGNLAYANDYNRVDQIRAELRLREGVMQEPERQRLLMEQAALRRKLNLY